jgi:hypothetical protein
VDFGAGSEPAAFGKAGDKLVVLAGEAAAKGAGDKEGVADAGTGAQERAGGEACERQRGAKKAGRGSGAVAASKLGLVMEAGLGNAPEKLLQPGDGGVGAADEGEEGIGGGAAHRGDVAEVAFDELGAGVAGGDGGVEVGVPEEGIGGGEAVECGRGSGGGGHLPGGNRWRHGGGGGVGSTLPVNGEHSTCYGERGSTLPINGEHSTC